MLDINQLQLELKNIDKKLQDIEKYIVLEELYIQKKDLEEIMSKPNFWDKKIEQEEVLKKLKYVNTKITCIKNIKQDISDIEYGIEVLKDLGSDLELETEIESKIHKVNKELEDIEMIELLGDKENLNAILMLHSGAGGTESCDWASMLYRMYTRWANDKDYDIEVIDIQPGDIVGFKSITIIIKGEYASELLRGEMGVHRLVRISPFDSSKRRHTSFASVEVLPELNDEIDIEISPDDIRVDVFRSSGAGGQHVNKTESAVRIVHIPTGIVVNCQNERSQIKNREKAMKVLKSKLYNRQLEIEKEKKKELKGKESQIAWGSQIRSYVFHPYSLVKDHRTNTEVGNVSSVMDGNISPFIYAYLVSENRRNNGTK